MQCNNASPVFEKGISVICVFHASPGMCHCDDLMYLFPLKELFSQKLSALDRAYTDFILDLFTTFATTG